MRVIFFRKLQMMRIIAHDIEVNYDLSGGEGAPVVMLAHALSSSLRMWDHQVPALTPHFRVLRYDIRGHGATDAPAGPYTLDQLGADAVALLDALGIERVHMVGLSMGGMIAQNLGLYYSHRLSSLVLCDTTAVMPDEAQAQWEERMTVAREEGMAGLVQATLERWFTHEFMEQNAPEVESIRKQILFTPVSGYLGCCEAIRRLKYLDQLHTIKLPVLIIVGDVDPATTIDDARAMHECIPHSKLVVLSGAAHLSNVQNPDEFNAALLDFLRER